MPRLKNNAFRLRYLAGQLRPEKRGGPYVGTERLTKTERDEIAELLIDLADDADLRASLDQRNNHLLKD